MKDIYKYLTGGLVAVILVLLTQKNDRLINIHSIHDLISDKSSYQDKILPQDKLELQSKCANQGKIIFIQLGYKLNSLDSYETHYNQKLSRCFISMRSYSRKAVTQSLIDAFEQKNFASYAWMSGEVKPFLCQLLPGSENMKTCSSDEEYQSFIKSYMED